MNKSAVFINIGRGANLKEEDLIRALKDQMIAGAVLDVFKEEPLPEDSELWECENLLMTPHCADQDHDFLKRTMMNFAENLDLFYNGKPLKFVTNKALGY